MTDAMPVPVEAMNAGLQQLIPRAYEMGVRFLELEPGHVRATVPFAGNGNHFGTVYAGVTFTVAEILGGALHLATFDSRTHYPLVRSLTIDFLAPGRTDLVAETRLDDATIERVRAESADGNKAAFVLEATVTGTDGVVVARSRGDYQIRAYERPSAADAQ